MKPIFIYPLAASFVATLLNLVGAISVSWWIIAIPALAIPAVILATAVGDAFSALVDWADGWLRSTDRWS